MFYQWFGNSHFRNRKVTKISRVVHVILLREVFENLKGGTVSFLRIQLPLNKRKVDIYTWLNGLKSNLGVHRKIIIEWITLIPTDLFWPKILDLLGCPCEDTQFYMACNVPNRLDFSLSFGSPSCMVPRFKLS